LSDIVAQNFEIKQPPVKQGAWVIPARTSWIISGVILALMTAFFWRNEWPTANFFFSTSITISIIAFITMLTGRVLFATILAASQVVIVALAATIKLKTMDMLVHAYDLFFYLNSFSTVTFLIKSFPQYAFGLFGALLTMVLLGILFFWLDSTKISRWKSAVTAAVFGLIGFLALEYIGERRHMHLYYSDRFVSTYYGSWPETIRTVARGQLIEAAPHSTGPAFTGLGSCETGQKKPHVILIHQESLVPPSHFPELVYDKSVDPMFKSFDGKLHKMRVETYGGASWLTEFSVLAGVSTYSFGSMRQFVQAFMEGKVKETIPQVMADCGYRNVLFYPMMKNFVSNARFYESIGLKEIFDMKDQGAPTTNERDRFYYTSALGEMEKHFKTSEKPLFTFIQTMSAHWPYDWKMFPDQDVPGGAPGVHPELDEYLRRVSIAAKDYSWLKAELKRRFPNESFVIVNYGDHQPSATRMLLGQKDEIEVEDIKLAADGPGFLTYYSVETQNWKAPAMSNLPVVDVPYFGLLMLEAARLPLSPAYQERKRLMEMCEGRYHTCADSNAILSFHRKLIDSRILESR
jgi:phosphoglycerol transferase MdoB-like AlkP superfamily enzyme